LINIIIKYRTSFLYSLVRDSEISFYHNNWPTPCIRSDFNDALKWCSVCACVVARARACACGGIQETLRVKLL